jgi:hypothetical protein
VSEEFDQEDLAAFGVLDDLARGRDDTAPIPPIAPDSAPPADEAVEVLRRLYVESLGLMAYSLDPVQPQRETRATILAHLIGDETQEVPPMKIGAATAQARPLAEVTRPAFFPPVAEEPPAIERAPERAVERAFEPDSLRSSQARRSSSRRWPVALAALFALAAVGLGVWAAMLQSEVAYRDAQIRGLEERLADADRLAQDLQLAKAELEQLQERYSFVTSPALTVYPLRPPPAGSLQPTARGHLFLAADRRHWQLEVRGLKPEPEPQDYQLWFIVDGLPLSGGVFDARAGKSATLADSSMPAGTTAVAITLERKGGTASPTSPILLIADSSVQI